MIALQTTMYSTVLNWLFHTLLWTTWNHGDLFKIWAGMLFGHQLVCPPITNQLLLIANYFNYKAITFQTWYDRYGHFLPFPAISLNKDIKYDRIGSNVYRVRLRKIININRKCIYKLKISFDSLAMAILWKSTYIRYKRI